MILNDFKNVKHFGKQKLVIKGSVIKNLRIWKEVVLEEEENENKNLFYNFRTFDSYNSKRFGEYFISVFKNHFGKKINLNLLRSIRSNWIENQTDKTNEEKNELHRKLLHSPNEGRLYNKV